MKSPSDGDRRDLGGKLPQFDAFAEFAYRELNAGKLRWIRIADPEALTLDDIQYATTTTIHAYQVKWSNLEKPEPFSYTDLKKIIPELIEGWKKLRVEYTSENKSLIVHLLSNRPASSHDSVKDKSGVKAGSFKEFIQQVWTKIKLEESVDLKWKNVSLEFLDLTGLSGNEFNEFISGCDLDINFSPDGFGIGKKTNKTRNDDLLKFSRFLFERVVSKDKKVLFSSHDIIDMLEWNSRFNTLFNHELVVDPVRYRPISKTIGDLNKIIGSRMSGYVFLSGGPGSGKSSLLTQWAKTKYEYTVIRYYAYDFNNPASMFNSSKRGEAVSLFFDLVLQLKNQNVYREDTLMQDDIQELRKIFDRQLGELSKIFKETGKKTIFIIDGLDHIPREYHGVIQSFLSELPPPAALPDGVIIILGSQTFNLEMLQSDVRQAWEKNDRNVEMSPLPRHEVFSYIDQSNLSTIIEEAQKQKLFEISQGHPLYLAYLINRIKETDDLDFLNNELTLDGDIEVYYKKCWTPIGKDANLVNFLGLVSRINGDINIPFIKEWNFDDAIKKAFKVKTSFLFQAGVNGWHFFHNSFRQFLIRQSALDPLDDTFDGDRDTGYHFQLAKYYEISKTEDQWNRLRHLFMAGDYDSFINDATPENFKDQFLAFRAEEEIESDIHLGFQIAKQLHAPYLVIRYLFALSELRSRQRFTTSSSFIEQFLEIGKPIVAKRLTRNNNKVLVNTDFALEACQWFFEKNEQEEAKMLFSLVEPNEISSSGIKISTFNYNRDIFKTMRRWASAAILFYPLDILLQKINNIEYEAHVNEDADSNKLNNLRSAMMYEIGKVLIRQDKIDELECILSQFKKSGNSNKIALLQEIVLKYCDHNDTINATAWLQRLKQELAEETPNEETQLLFAHLTFKITGDTSATKALIEGIKQPEILDDRKIGEDRSLMKYSKRILLNLLLNLTGQGQPIAVVVPNSSVPDEGIFVDFERKLCMIAQLAADGILKKPLPDNLSPRISPMLRYYYQKEFTTRFNHNSYKWHKLTAIAPDYFKYLISSVSAYGVPATDALSLLFLEEFTSYPQYWSAELQRVILIELHRYGAERTVLIKHMKSLEVFMFNGKDVSGRTDEAYAQAKAWIELDEAGLAENWMRATLQQTLGIGYRKDYQFNVWVEWLQGYLKDNATHAATLFAKLASYLPHIKELTELSPSRDACHALLNAAFEHNSSWGLQLMIWSLKKGLLDFETAVATCLKDQLLKAGNKDNFKLALDIYQHFYLYIAKSFKEDLLEELLKKGFEISRLAFLETDIPDLINEININAIQENRSFYNTILIDFLDSHGYRKSKIKELFGFIPERKERAISNNTLSLLKGRKQLSESEVLKSVNNPKELIQLLNDEDTANSYFSWEKVFEKVKKVLSLEDVNIIYDLNRRGNRSSELLTILSICALELGDKELAKKMVLTSLEQSSSSGWDSYYDGGSRIKAFKAWQIIDPKIGYVKSLEMFVDDILQSKHGNDYIYSLDSILPAITTAPDINRIWVEIESYLERLMANSGGETRNDIPKLNNLPEINVLPDLLLYLYKFDIRVFKSKIRNLIVSALGSHSIVKEKLITMSGGNEYEQEKFIEAINLYGAKYPEGIIEFCTQLSALAVSENMWIRNDARKILLNYLPEIQIPIPHKKELPIIYKLIIPIDKSFIRPSAIDGSELIKDTNSILEIIHPFEKWLDILYDRTGFKPGSILQRWGQILHERYSDEITAACEEEKRTYHSSAGLDYSFPRPRNTAVLRALGRLIAELVDAQAISNLDFLDDLQYDYNLEAEVSVSKRPSFISLIQGEKKIYLSDDWVHSISESKRLEETVKYDFDGSCVAGDYSTLKSLDWGTPEETIAMHLTLDGELSFEDNEIPFAEIYKCPFKDYYQIKCLSPSPYIIVKNVHDFKNPGLMADWIAFNPTLAHLFGWQPSSKGIFSWENESGAFMAESVYWLDGNNNMRPPLGKSEAGEGWYVRISQQALKQLSDFPSSFFTIHRRIIRERNYDGKQEKEVFDQLIDEWEK